IPQLPLTRLESRVVLYLPTPPFDVEEEAAVFSCGFHDFPCVPMLLSVPVCFPVENKCGQVQSGDEVFRVKPVEDVMQGGSDDSGRKQV
ncbi:hypothetical protein PMAYCL1PPCAC_27984, partial [Pristionchus mayeri]